MNMELLLVRTKKRLVSLRGFFEVEIDNATVRDIDSEYGRTASGADDEGVEYNTYPSLGEKESLLQEKFEYCQKIGAVTFASSFAAWVFPLMVNVPLLVLCVINPCITYATPLFITIISIYSTCLGLSYVNNIVYNKYMLFCTYDSLHVHVVHVCIFNLMLACTMGYYNLYAYDANIGYFLGATISGMGALCEFFICIFFREHFYACISEGCGKPPSKKIWCFKAIDDCLTTLSVLFTIFWMGFLIAPVVMQRYLYYYDDVMRPEESCPPLL